MTQRLSFAKTLRATEFHSLTMLQACAQGVDLKADRDFGEGQPVLREQRGRAQPVFSSSRRSP
jgi:hypothetical protein